MMNRSAELVFVSAISIVFAGSGRAQLTKDQSRRIDEAAPKAARVAPKAARRVLIWNTPFMDTCPHKGYCVPQGEHAMKLLGEKTAAFEPVVSDDAAMFLPETLARFDAIIMNNSNGKDLIRIKML